MAVGLLFTRIVKLVKLPNVTGYLIAGLLIGPSVLGLIDKATVESFNMIVTLALGFIAFSIGGEFKLGTLKKLGKNVTVITFFQAIGAVAVVFVVLLVAGLPADGFHAFRNRNGDGSCRDAPCGKTI